jgi:DnaJ homolog subfamily C member 28
LYLVLIHHLRTSCSGGLATILRAPDSLQTQWPKNEHLPRPLCSRVHQSKNTKTGLLFSYVQSVLDVLYGNRTGDENIRDTVLRMLVDKYKPSRTGHIEAADDKIKHMMPKVMSPPAQVHIPTGVDGEHKPWLVTFKVPSHATSTPAIKYGRLPPSPRTVLSTLDTTPDDPRAQAEARRLKKRVAGADQLTKARELALDYRLGGSLVAVRSPHAMPKNPKSQMEEESDRSQISRRMQPNPASIKAWASLIEEKIEVRDTTTLFLRFPFLKLS